MHLVIPFAHCRSEGCALALRTLKLAHLHKLLANLNAAPADPSDPSSLSAPHERAWARALGLPLTDGMIPWAALQARQTLAADGAWGFITPCHWKIGSQHVIMSGSPLMDFSDQDSRTLLSAMQPYFAEDGITLHYHQATRWLAQSNLFDKLATASLDRAAGHDVSDWLPDDPRASKLRRLQSEMQMLLYKHPVNESRSERGLPAVNSFWLSGTGALPPDLSPGAGAAPVVAAALRDAALNEDWPTWARAWEQLDAGQCATLLQALRRGEAVQLTLCGERATQTFVSGSSDFRRSLVNLFKSPSVISFLEPL